MSVSWRQLSGDDRIAFAIITTYELGPPPIQHVHKSIIIIIIITGIFKVA